MKTIAKKILIILSALCISVIAIIFANDLSYIYISRERSLRSPTVNEAILSKIRSDIEVSKSLSSVPAITVESIKMKLQDPVLFKLVLVKTKKSDWQILEDCKGLNEEVTGIKRVPFKE